MTTQLRTFLRLILLNRLHSGEQQHLLDVIAIGEEHGESIDSESPSSRRRESMLESGAEVLIETLRLFVSLGLVLGLLHEPLSLHYGVVQLGVRVRQLRVVHEQLEPLAQTRLAAMVLGQRRADGRVVADEGRVQTERLHEVLDELVQKTRRGQRRRALDLQLLAGGHQEIVGLLGL